MSGVYISVKPNKETEIKLKEFQKNYILNPNNNLHVTLIYSKKENEFKYIKTRRFKKFKATFKKWEIFDENTLVAILETEDLINRNKELVNEYDFISDFNEYTPHITLSYNFNKLLDLPKLNFELIFNNETSEELDINK